MAQGNTTANSRFCILSWINDTLLLNVQKIEQLGSGSIYCQLLDAAYPERVPLHKVKWEAKLQTEFLHNFKILQTSFQYLGIEKRIEMQKLCKAKYQDNFEFVQWIRNFLQDKIDYETYEPLRRRNYSKVYLDFVAKKKFTVTLNPINNNKENCGNSEAQNSLQPMKYSLKSSSSMSDLKSSVILSGRSSLAYKDECKHLKNSKSDVKLLSGCKSSKNLGSRIEKVTDLGKKKSFCFVSQLSKMEIAAKTSQIFSKKRANYIKNVDIIESGDEEQ